MANSISGAMLSASPRKGWRVFAIAASLLLVLAAGAAFNERTDYLTGEHYTTRIGGLNSVPLADGSTVTLNTDTSLRVTLSGHERRIRLEKGEAFFDVARDPARPFVVYAGNDRITAVGTQFSVRREEDDVRVVVTAGKVKLAQPSQSRLLEAGVVARAARSGIAVSEGSHSHTEQMLAWRGGYVAFQDTPLSEAVAEFNRYTTRRIHIEDPSIATIRVGGNFRSNNAAAFLDLLGSGFPIVVEQGEDRITLRHR
jgi:transmembrane sensor